MSAAPDALPEATGHRCLSRRSAIGGVACAGLAVPFLAACSSDSSSQSGSDGGQTADAGTPLAPTSDIPVGGGVIYADQGVVVTQPTEGDFKAFGAECTHQGCTVTEVTETIDCACHGSSFSLEDGAPTAGPATDPLPTVEITVENDEITVA
ncbi:Rieske (2Fe-2S) protein [Nocardioides sp. CFH 31398]|uniref:Rieske (2Fe-2S) protein n=1 Tax=Nocardioides sp. CFH 31398 TaxID=2919579 RepID=UPI001F06A085|nr:Rieske (2Fe-2S) protein [Nocardioides sp. CFH 31398]MCH1866728.1 Rieske (2Fe-2S) protein [Nocardioides sp. CFH 31398]